MSTISTTKGSRIPLLIENRRQAAMMALKTAEELLLQYADYLPLGTERSNTLNAVCDVIHARGLISEEV